MKPFDPPLNDTEVMNALPAFKVVATLTPGGQGAVFRCVDANQNSCVLKIYGKNTELVRVEREIKKLRAITSPYIVKLLDHGIVTIRSEVCRYSVVEFVEGTDLTQATGAWDDKRVRKVLHDVSHGIEAMWQNRVVHRDIKRANVMERATAGGYAIIDLGLAKHLDEKTVTMFGRTCGTIGYMSPEQANARKGLTFRSDLYALGVMMYELVTGVHPFGGNQYTMAAGGRAAPIPLTKISKPVSELVAQMLEPSVLARPGSCADVYNVCGGP